MNFDFERILFYATIITGVLSLLDLIFLAPRRKKRYQQKCNIISEYAYSFFPILLIVLVLRSFLFEPFRIPSGSLEPSLHVGDFILLNKYDYGLRLPIIRKEILPIGSPKRGDIMVFRWPPNPTYYFIKRVIGVPGDHISYINKELIINGQKIPQTTVPNTEANAEYPSVIEKEENLLGIKHRIYLDPDHVTRDFKDIIVPPGMYFMMGDNRDFSADSRFFGFVPDKNIVGKAVLVWLSWDSNKSNVRWKRFGTVIH